MKIRYFAYFFTIGILLSFYNSFVYAGRPMWTLTPQTATNVVVASNSTATIRYTLTNQTQKTVTLTMKSIQGITQDTSPPGACTSPISLPQRQSCTLILRIDGSSLTSSISGGPDVCQTNANNTPNSNACYQPSANNQLNITKAATITASVSTLGLSVNCPTSNPGCTYYNAALTGKSRIITITNNSPTNTVFNVSYSATPAFPTGTTMTPTRCDMITPLSSCVFTITPGQTPSAAPGDINPTPITVTIAGDNTSTASVAVSILTYGSVYQAGYLFSVDDTTSNTSSISGTAVGLSDPSIPTAWQPSCNDVSTCTSTNANDYFNGATNTANIVYALRALPSSTYAAGICDTNTAGGYDNWYLPAVCQLGFGDGSNPCGVDGSPTIQNIQSNLVDNGISDLIETYWSSTQIPNLELTHAFFNIFGSPGSQGGEIKENALYIRCVRNLS